jgi:transcriptional regulator with XRE-family HTH domain
LYSVRQLADRVGISATYLSQIERDQIPPPAEEVIQKLEIALKVPPGTFFRESERIPDSLLAAYKEKTKQGCETYHFWRLAHAIARLNESACADMLSVMATKGY